MTQDNNPKYVIVPKEPTDEMVDAHVVTPHRKLPND